MNIFHLVAGLCAWIWYSCMQQFHFSSWALVTKGVMCFFACIWYTKLTAQAEVETEVVHMPHGLSIREFSRVNPHKGVLHDYRYTGE